MYVQVPGFPRIMIHAAPFSMKIIWWEEAVESAFLVSVWRGSLRTAQRHGFFRTSLLYMCLKGVKSSFAL